MKPFTGYVIWKLKCIREFFFHTKTESFYGSNKGQLRKVWFNNDPISIESSYDLKLQSYYNYGALLERNVSGLDWCNSQRNSEN